ncbi:MAG: DUF4956 domain-containing protein [Lachnospiraceae bacterium]|nr:DUF4956 domain-containing protein [Lachnospiraceae bacterium]
MNFKDAIKKSVLNSFVYGQTLNAETIFSIVLNMFLSLFIGMLIFYIYKKYFQGAVFSRTFAMTLVGMTVLSCMVTLAISTNIVISLGMVGALSIVRYRTAVKEPLDLLYLFWAITSGITLGAGMYMLAVIGALFMLTIIRLFALRFRQNECYMMILHTEGETDMTAIQESFGKLRYSTKSQVLRKEQSEITIQFAAEEKELSVTEKVRALPFVKDVTLVKYNGEYHG